MRRPGKVVCLLLFMGLIGCAVPESEPEPDAEQLNAVVAASMLPHWLPAETLAYVCLQGLTHARTLWPLALHPEADDPPALQTAQDRLWAAMIAKLAGQIPYKLDAVQQSRLIDDIEGVHVALAVLPQSKGKPAKPDRIGGEPPRITLGDWPTKSAPMIPAGGKPWGEARAAISLIDPPAHVDFLICIQFYAGQGVSVLLKALEEHLHLVPNTNGRMHRLNDGFGFPYRLVFTLLDNTTLLIGGRPFVESVVNKSFAGNSLAAHALFARAKQELPQHSELFAFVNLEEARKAYPESEDKDIRAVAASLSLQGNQIVRVYPAQGTRFSRPFPQAANSGKWLRQMPSSAVLAWVSAHAAGGGPGREFLSWLQQELTVFPGIRSLLDRIAAGCQGAEFGRLSQVPPLGGWGSIGRKFLEAVPPAHGSTAAFLASNRDGTWRSAALLEVEDPKHAVEVFQRILSTSELQKLNWKSDFFAEATLHYARMGEQPSDERGPQSAATRGHSPAHPDQLAYAVRGKLLVFGSLDAVKFVLKPGENTLDQRIDLRGLDTDHQLLIALWPWPMVQDDAGLCAPIHAPPELRRLVLELGPKASCVMTVKWEPERITLRWKAPMPRLAWWWLREFTQNFKGVAPPPNSASPGPLPATPSHSADDQDCTEAPSPAVSVPAWKYRRSRIS